MSAHRYKTAAECNCDRGGCFICDGGLAWCVHCKCMEGGLPTDCPGITVPMDTEGDIYQGKIDYQNGEWWLLKPRLLCLGADPPF